MRALGFFCCFILLCLKAEAQVMFRFNQAADKQSNADSFGKSPAILNDSLHSYYCYSGALLNSRFESHVGGNDTNLQAVLMCFDTASDIKDSIISVLPIGMALKSIYWGLPFVNIQIPFIDVPFVLCVLPKDSNKFELFSREFRNAPDFKWVDVPQKKESAHSVFQPTNIDEYYLPLPCSHDPVYLIYLDDSTLNLSIDDKMYLNMNTDSSFHFIEGHLRHLQNYHGSYCERLATIFFSNRNVDMKKATELFEWFSEANVQLKLIFSTND
jgi:hypothetical protein